MLSTPINARRHGRRCGCSSCIADQLREFEHRISYFGDIKPPTLGHTVPVRPHWRKVKKHLSYNPVLQDLVEGIIRDLKRGKH